MIFGKCSLRTLAHFDFFKALDNFDGPDVTLKSRIVVKLTTSDFCEI